MLTPTLEHALELLALINTSEQLDPTAALLGWPEAHQVELTGVTDPSRTVQRTVLLLTPPQSDIELT